jgi:polyisoprenoid-binding protein YceI
MKRILKNQPTTILMLLAAIAIIGESSRLQGQTKSENTSYVAHYSGQGIGSSKAEEATFKLSSSNDVVMNIAGTTPLKNWTMMAHGLCGDAKMTVTKDNHLAEIQELCFNLPVHNLKGEGSGMDNDAYKALKADQYHDIVFRMISANIEPRDAHHYDVKARGNLTVAGVTREVVLQMAGNAAKDGSITFAGSEQVKMSDYNVERPSILFGVIKAGDVMTLTYNLIFIK